MTQAIEPNDRIDLEALMAQAIQTIQIIAATTAATTAETNRQMAEYTAETNRQLREVSIQIKAQATFHDRFEQELSETRKLIQSNAKAIQSSGDSFTVQMNREIEQTKYELAAIRELRRSMRTSHAESLDRNNALQESIEDLRDEIKELNNKIDRQSPPPPETTE